MSETGRPASRITVFGGAILDVIARADTAAIPGASNPGRVRRLSGGVGFNVAAILARLGTSTRLVSCVGDDAEGRGVLASARAAGLDVSGVAAIPGGATAAYHAALDSNGSLIIGIADMNVLARITPAYVEPHARPAQDGDLWVLDANLPEETIAFLALEARKAGVPVAALTVSPAKVVRFRDVLDDIALVFTNTREAAALLDLDPNSPDLQASDLASSLAAGRRAAVIVTDGDKPVAVAKADAVRTYVPMPVRVQAVNGAGDSFAAGVLYAVAGGKPLEDAIPVGLRAARLTLAAGSITSAGFRPGLLETSKEPQA